jgi:hypothetical protein
MHLPAYPFNARLDLTRSTQLFVVRAADFTPPVLQAPLLAARAWCTAALATTQHACSSSGVASSQRTASARQPGGGATGANCTAASCRDWRHSLALSALVQQRAGAHSAHPSSRLFATDTTTSSPSGADATSTPPPPGAPPLDTSQEVTFPPLSAGAVILGRIQKSEEVREAERTKRHIEAMIFDQHYSEGSASVGRKRLAKPIRGPFVADYYLDKHRDPLMVNEAGRERQAVRALGVLTRFAIQAYTRSLQQ